LENVKQFKTHDEGKTFATVIERLKELGYFTHTGILNALNYGVCQKRERTFIVGFRANIAFKFPTPLTDRPSLASLLEPDDTIEPKLWASEMIQKKRLERLKAQGTPPFSNN
jgi:DNA (cytosine-5)-methyltransferase 1